MGGQLWKNRGVVGNALNRYGVRSMRPLFSSGVLREGAGKCVRLNQDYRYGFMNVLRFRVLDSMDVTLHHTKFTKKLTKTRK